MPRSVSVLEDEPTRRPRMEPAMPDTPWVRGWCAKSRARSVDGSDLLCLLALGTLGDLELDRLVLIETAVAVTLDCREVDEHVRAAAVQSDEAEALLGVEPLDCSGCH